jgi:hypothetical protein
MIRHLEVCEGIKKMKKNFESFMLIDTGEFSREKEKKKLEFSAIML